MDNFAPLRRRHLLKTGIGALASLPFLQTQRLLKSQRLLKGTPLQTLQRGVSAKLAGETPLLLTQIPSPLTHKSGFGVILLDPRGVWEPC